MLVVYQRKFRNFWGSTRAVRRLNDTICIKEQCLTIRRSMRYDSVRKKTQIGPTKRKKIRTVDFCDTLAVILREAKKEQMLNSIKYGPLYSQNYYRILSHGAAPKDVQELLGHSDVSTTMNIYAHATREAKRTSARLLDKVVGTA